MQLLRGVTAFLILSPELASFNPMIGYSVYLGIVTLIGFLTGFQFTNANLIRDSHFNKISGKTYSYDLFGSALGALLLTIYLVPKIGIITSAILISFLNFIFGIFLSLNGNKRILL